MRLRYEYNSSFRPIDKILFCTDWTGLLLNSTRMQRISFPRNKRRGEERRGHRPVAKIEEEARKRKKKKEKGKEKANGKIEKQEGRCEGTEKARDKGEADTQDACVDTLRPSPSPSCSSVESKYVDRRRAHD